MQNILTSQNRDWGFYGTMATNTKINPDLAWQTAMKVLTGITVGTTEEALRSFLDSKQGRHFADDVSNELFSGKELEDAIEDTGSRWMDWKIGNRTEERYGIPAGLPYLQGWVSHEDIQLDSE